MEVSSVEAEEEVKVAGVVEEEAVREAVVAAARTRLKASLRVKARRERYTPDMAQPDIRTSLHSRPVLAIGALASLRTFVKSQGPVHGKINGFPGQINEIRASPVK